MYHYLLFLDAMGSDIVGHTSASVLLQSCHQQSKSERWIARRCEAKRKNERLGWERAWREGRGIFTVMFNKSREKVGEADARADEALHWSTIGGTEHRRSTQWEHRTTEMLKFDRIGLLCFICPRTINIVKSRVVSVVVSKSKGTFLQCSSLLSPSLMHFHSMQCANG